MARVRASSRPSARSPARSRAAQQLLSARQRRGVYLVSLQRPSRRGRWGASLEAIKTRCNTQDQVRLSGRAPAPAARARGCALHAQLAAARGRPAGQSGCDQYNMRRPRAGVSVRAGATAGLRCRQRTAGSLADKPTRWTANRHPNRGDSPGVDAEKLTGQYSTT